MRYARGIPRAGFPLGGIMRRQFLLVALFLVVAGWFVAIGRPTAFVEAAAPAPDDAVDRAAKALYEGIRFEKLENGLRVYLKPVPSSPVVSTMVAYKVGSADEELTSTGLSHYLEHLMFKGTDKIMPGDFDRLTFRAGGRNNAYTTEDLTNYHFDFASDQRSEERRVGT